MPPEDEQPQETGGGFGKLLSVLLISAGIPLVSKIVERFSGSPELLGEFKKKQQPLLQKVRQPVHRG